MAVPNSQQARDTGCVGEIQWKPKSSNTENLSTKVLEKGNGLLLKKHQARMQGTSQAICYETAQLERKLTPYTAKLIQAILYIFSR